SHERRGRAAPPQGAGGRALSPARRSPSEPAARTNRTARALSLALAVALAAIGWLLWTRREPPVSPASVSASAIVPAPIEIFWKGFVRGPEEPWGIFITARFFWRPHTRMRYYH